MTVMNFEKWRRYCRARAFEVVKQPERALEEYRAALVCDPAFVKALLSIAYIHATRRRHADAEGSYLAALRIRPRDADTWFNLGFVRDQMKQHASAIEAFKEAVQRNPMLDRAWYGMGLAHAALGDHRAAMEALDKAANMQPMGSPVWYQLGMACHHAHEPERVRQIIKHLNRFDPRMARRLILETGTTDLAHLVKDLVV